MRSAQRETGWDAPAVTPEQVEQLFSELRQSVVGTRIKFHLQETATTIEGVLIDTPGERPPGLDEGVFLQDLEDHTQIYCLCEDRGTNGVGNILVHTFVQAGVCADRDSSPVFNDETSERLRAAEGAFCGGGITQEEHVDFQGVVDTDAPPPPPAGPDITQPLW